MELGKKLRRARLEAGLSQRQLCGEEITRNMLSLIEHGNARPSMDTLKYLAARLGKPVSFFLEEDAVCSPNQGVMETVRRLFDAGEYAQAALALEAYQSGDPVFDREQSLLRKLLLLALAEQAIEEDREPYALELLEKAKPAPAYCAEGLERRRLLLLGRLRGRRVSGELPSLDEELLLRAEEALASGKTDRAEHLLEAAEEQQTPRWNFLRGEVYLSAKAYREAAGCFHRAEAAFPRETAVRLEHCYRELEDYKRAYEYACRQR